MAISILCMKCKTSMDTKKKQCPNCKTNVPREDKKFRIRFKYNYKTYSKVVTGNLELAKKIQRKMRQQVEDGSFFKAKPKEYTIEEIYNKYVDENSDLKSMRCIEYRYRLYIKDFIGKKKMDEVTESDVLRIRKKMEGKGLAPKTVRHVLELIQRFFNYAKKKGIFRKQNPVDLIKMPKINNTVIRYLTIDQIEKLFEVLDDFHNQEDANILKCLFFSGARKNEILSLRWEDIDFDSGIITLQQTKSGKADTIIMTDEIREILINQKEIAKIKNELVFPSKKKGILRKSFHKPWYAIRKLAGIPDWRIHDLRHNYASYLINSGKITPQAVQHLLRHKDYRTTLKYAHYFKTEQRKHAEVFADLVKRDK